MINNTIESYMGFLQVQHKDYLDDPTIDNSFSFSEGLVSQLSTLKDIKAVVPRLESFALASSGLQTKGVAVIGIDPIREKELSNPEAKLVKYKITSDALEKLRSKRISPEIKNKLSELTNRSYINLSALQADLKLGRQQEQEFLPVFAEFFAYQGSMFSADERAVLVSERLARFLKISCGDTVILMGQGYHGASATGIFTVKGIIKIPAPDLDNKLIYMPLKIAQEFFDMEGKITSVSVNLYDNSDKGMKEARELLINRLSDNKLVVKTWKEFNEVLFQQIQSDNQTGQIMIGFLYLVVFFGIFGTVLMMVHERRHEFGILISIGMKRFKLLLITILEMLLMGLMGVISGIVLSIPLLYLGSEYPVKLTGNLAQIMEEMGLEAVMPLEWIDTYVLWQGLIVALMVIFSCIYPLRKIFTISETDALRSK
jgi:ABC-type lipoprotein release transport system permease subunit